MESKNFKIEYRNEIRRVPLRSYYEELQQQIKELFNLNESSFLIKYKDEEGDLITISSQIELNEALELFENKIIRLTIFDKESPKKKREAKEHHRKFKHGKCRNKQRNKDENNNTNMPRFEIPPFTIGNLPSSGVHNLSQFPFGIPLNPGQMPPFQMPPNPNQMPQPQPQMNMPPFPPNSNQMPPPPMKNNTNIPPFPIPPFGTGNLPYYGVPINPGQMPINMNLNSPPQIHNYSNFCNPFSFMQNILHPFCQQYLCHNCKRLALLQRYHCTSCKDNLVYCTECVEKKELKNHDSSHLFEKANPHNPWIGIIPHFQPQSQPQEQFQTQSEDTENQINMNDEKDISDLYDEFPQSNTSNYNQQPNYSLQVQELQSMGFTDLNKIQKALSNCNGNLEMALELLMYDDN